MAKSQPLTYLSKSACSPDNINRLNKRKFVYYSLYPVCSIKWGESFFRRLSPHKRQTKLLKVGRQLTFAECIALSWRVLEYESLCFVLNAQDSRSENTWPKEHLSCETGHYLLSSFILWTRCSLLHECLLNSLKFLNIFSSTFQLRRKFVCVRWILSLTAWK